MDQLQNLGAVGGLILVSLALVELLKRKTNGHVAEEVRKLAAQLSLLQGRIDSLISMMSGSVRESTGQFQLPSSEPTLRIKIEQDKQPKE